MVNQVGTMRERDSDTGRYTPGFSDNDLTAALEQLDGAAGTTEIAEETGASYDAVYQRLRQLENAGVVDRRKIANANLWILAEDSDG